MKSLEAKEDMTKKRKKPKEEEDVFLDTDKLTEIYTDVKKYLDKKYKLNALEIKLLLMLMLDEIDRAIDHAERLRLAEIDAMENVVEEDLSGFVV